MGIEFRESSMLIAPKTQVTALKGQVYNLNVGLSGLTNADAKEKEGKTYALFIGDTVVVNEVRLKFIFILCYLRDKYIWCKNGWYWVIFPSYM